MKTVMVDQERVTKGFYDTLTPFEQGYTTYFQAEWAGAEIPKTNPHPVGTKEHQDWADGMLKGTMDAMEVEE